MGHVCKKNCKGVVNLDSKFEDLPIQDDRDEGISHICQTNSIRLNAESPPNHVVDSNNEYDRESESESESEAESESESEADDDDCQFEYSVQDEDWDKCQRYLDLMFLCWILMYGPSSVFNYLHILGSGHLTFYGKRLRNLSVFAQQVRFLNSNGRLELEFFFFPCTS